MQMQYIILNIWSNKLASAYTNFTMGILCYKLKSSSTQIIIVQYVEIIYHLIGNINGNITLDIGQYHILQFQPFIKEFPFRFIQN